MNDAALFDEIVREHKLGPRIEDDHLQKHPLIDRLRRKMRGIVSSAISKFTGEPSIYVAFLADPEFNAWAAQNSGRYFIGIHAGLLTILTSVVFRLLADPRTFPEIGDAREETNDLATFSTITPDASECDFVRVEPKNPQRQLFAVHLCDLVFDFIIAHELTHIGHGHVGYQAAEVGIPFLGERRWSAGTPAGNLESLAMEMDADFTAAELVMRSIRRWMVDRTAASGLAEFYSDPVRGMFGVAAAISIQSRMFGDTRVAIADLPTQDHPPDRWRQLMTLNVMLNYAEELWGSKLHDSLLGTVNRAIAEVEEAFERMTGQAQQVQGLHDTWHGEGWAYAKQVNDCWNSTLMPKLEKYAFVELSSYGFDVPEQT